MADNPPSQNDVALELCDREPWGWFYLSKVPKGVPLAKQK
jgi:hypothetical protein